MPTSLRRTLTKTVTENMASAFVAVSEIQSAFHKLILSLLLLKEESKIIMHKLEPREDVLSPVISKAMSPKRTLGDMGVV